MDVWPRCNWDLMQVEARVKFYLFTWWINITWIFPAKSFGGAASVGDPSGDLYPHLHSRIGNESTPTHQVKTSNRKFTFTVSRTRWWRYAHVHELREDWGNIIRKQRQNLTSQLWNYAKRSSSTLPSRVKKLFLCEIWIFVISRREKMGREMFFSICKMFLPVWDILHKTCLKRDYLSEEDQQVEVNWRGIERIISRRNKINVKKALAQA